MDRREIITRHISKADVGIEIGPWHSPLTPKAMGYKCLVMDVFDSETLLKRASADPSISARMRARIEPVDLVGTSSEIAHLVDSAGLLGKLDYIVSSHNFEHIPDPIRFLQGCETALKPNGLLSMAIPDRRGCFDFFRYNSSSAQVIDAYFDKRTRPSNAQIFEQIGFTARFIENGIEHSGFSMETDPARIVPYQKLRESFDLWESRHTSGDTTYLDAHCWTFTPASFELVLADLNFLGLTRIQVEDIALYGGEFHVHLRNQKMSSIQTNSQEFYERRRTLLLKVGDESAVTSLAYRRLIEDEQARGEKAGQKNDSARVLSSDATTLQEQLRQRDSEVASLRAANGNLRQQYSDIKSSTSWRITEPLRRMVETLRLMRRHS